MALLKSIGKIFVAAVVGPTVLVVAATIAAGVLYGLGCGLRALGVAPCHSGDCILVGFITTMFASGFAALVFLTYEILWDR